MWRGHSLGRRPRWAGRGADLPVEAHGTFRLEKGDWHSGEVCAFEKDGRPVPGRVGWRRALGAAAPCCVPGQLWVWQGAQ